ncbi:TPA: carboxymuconolactone decarboxylase family protein [Klebsiella michiganensis]|uniref:carboxymuconolactone decarboxylase family protein n=1 Tax=Klebsiella TaxID=570 RepID=UPI00141C2BCA|nr:MULTISPECIES: carboxymuconolactone decarboxylase family protein [Klebsiella]MBK4131800.1 carboxymuconolactone decarboxylase family protein [Klebsiella michiganensis]MBS6910042.1 carboxymuconolactone decarboxylase family protein [Klebsiella sp.]MDM4114172.1 carboxymuconolactone decarboxylase family protein [Klebsiella michiganensis]MDM4347608.1 carboxymuconolactone decarboxylase family protein [Klebsiella michiganensis]MDM4353489.1 carboxymuconolactone decarboxylase family protein [Klebsiell
MEQRRVNGKNHWYHETQSTICPVDVLPLVPEAAHVEDRFLLDLTLPRELLEAHARWLTPARRLADALFPASVTVNRLQTFSAYDRLSTALTVAQVYGVQRLCNHYAARLAPLPGPDSSRESNRRLAQITQYARQLASSPSLINALARSQLDEVGLTSRDIILINQIIGFVSFQARAIAAFHAALGYPVRWIPGMPQQEDAPEALFVARESDWQPGLDDADLRYADDERQSLIANWRKHPGLSELAPLLAAQEPPLALQEQLLTHLSDRQPFAAQVALIAARINGSISCFNAWASRCPDLVDLTDALRGNESGVQPWGDNPSMERQLLQSVQLLTRAPDRFSAAQLTPLTDYGLSRSAAIDLLAWCGLCGWMNRLKIALGNVRQET